MTAFVRSLLFVLFAVPGILLLVGVPRPPRDASSAAAASLDARIEGSSWLLPRHEIELDVPQGWFAHSQGGREWLLRFPGQPDRGSINLITMPNTMGKTLERLERDNVAAIQAVGAELLSSSRTRLGSIEAMRFDYRGRIDGIANPQRCVCVVWLAGGRQLAMTARADESEWPQVGPQIEDALASLAPIDS